MRKQWQGNPKPYLTPDLISAPPNWAFRLPRDGLVTVIFRPQYCLSSMCHCSYSAVPPNIYLVIYICHFRDSSSSPRLNVLLPFGFEYFKLSTKIFNQFDYQRGLFLFFLVIFTYFNLSNLSPYWQAPFGCIFCGFKNSQNVKSMKFF